MITDGVVLISNGDVMVTYRAVGTINGGVMVINRVVMTTGGVVLISNGDVMVIYRVCQYY